MASSTGILVTSLFSAQSSSLFLSQNITGNQNDSIKQRFYIFIFKALLTSFFFFIPSQVNPFDFGLLGANSPDIERRHPANCCGKHTNWLLVGLHLWETHSIIILSAKPLMVPDKNSSSKKLHGDTVPMRLRNNCVVLF